MSLQVWLPLLENTNNQGLLNLAMTGSPASYGTGPLGQSATFTGSTANVIYNDSNLTVQYTDNFSWCTWIKTNFTGTSGQYAFTVGRADAGGYGYGLQCNSTTNCIVRFGNKQYNLAVTGGEWTHIAFTKQGTSLKVYKNGVLANTYTFDGTLPTYSDGKGLGLGCFHYTGNIYPFYGSLCDFRIYDHVLSAKEVKEISKALTIHLPLRGMDSNPNLVPNSQVWNNSVSVGNTTRTLVDCEGVQIQRFTAKQDITNGGIYTGSFGGNRWNGGRYTWSIEIRANREFTIPTVIHERFGGRSCNVGTDWRKFTHTGTYGQTSYNAFCMYFNATYPFKSGDWFEIRNFKVEEGDKATPWCPCVFDTDYSRLGYGTITTPYTLVGEPSNAQGYIGGFSSTKYINTGYTLNPGSNKWEVTTKITTGTNVTDYQHTIGCLNTSGSIGALFGIANGTIALWLSSNGTSFDIKDTRGGAISASTTYYIKYGWNSTEYYLDISTDGKTYTRDITVASTTQIHSHQIYVGACWDKTKPFLGSIDMESFKITVNENPAYIGAVTPISTIIKEDVSGYNRTVTPSGRITPVADTPKNYGVNFIGGNIVVPSGFPIDGNMPKWSVSMWYRPTGGCTFTTWSDVFTIWVNTEAGNNTTFRLENQNATGNSYRIYYNNSGQSAYGCTAFTLDLDTWYHLAFTCDGTKVYHYINAVLKSSDTLNTGFKPTGTTGQFRINDYNMFADYSDVRVYGTCLSAEDVKKLYDTPIAIDNTGKLHCSNLVENEGKQQLLSSGTVKATFNENSDYNVLKMYKDGDIASNEFIEL